MIAVVALIPRKRHEQREKRERGNGLNHPDDRENGLTERAAAACRDAKRQADQD